MSLKPVINVKCPCCNRVLEIDVESQRVTSHREGPHLVLDAKDGEDPLAVAKRAAADQRKKAEDRFARAQGDLKKTSDRLDALFRDAQKRAAEEAKGESEDPENPFAGGKVWD